MTNFINLNNCQSHVGLCLLLNVTSKSLNRALDDRSYHTFSIRKSNGGKRRIENPNENLSKIQRRLAVHFNNAYARHLPDCVHGYIPKAIAKSRRDIFSNALAHQQAEYMYNVDIKDFFHSINKKKIKSSLLYLFPGISMDVLKSIIKLVTYTGRLPMGAPSSPSLSNLCSVNLDNQLSDLANSYGITYTRYVDDFTFSSSSEPINSEIQTEIENVIEKNDFVLNQKKKKLFGKEDEKVITGIIVQKDKLDIVDDLHSEIIENIKNLASLKSTYQHMKMLNHQMTDLNKSKYGQLKASVKGQLKFAERVLGSSSSKFLELNSFFDQTMGKSNYINLTLYI